jgi:hypothetical protein
VIGNLSSLKNFRYEVVRLWRMCLSRRHRGGQWPKNKGTPRGPRRITTGFVALVTGNHVPHEPWFPIILTGFRVTCISEQYQSTAALGRPSVTRQIISALNFKLCPSSMFAIFEKKLHPPAQTTSLAYIFISSSSETLVCRCCDHTATYPYHERKFRT